jgi:hypothetical protein
MSGGWERRWRQAVLVMMWFIAGGWLSASQSPSRSRLHQLSSALLFFLFLFLENEPLYPVHMLVYRDKYLPVPITYSGTIFELQMCG